MKTKYRMTPQWIIFGIVTLNLGLEFAASAQGSNQALAGSECWNNPALKRQLFCHPYEPFPFETFAGCKNFSLQENTNPNITDIKKLDRQASFRGVDAHHQELLRKLVNILKSTPGPKQLVANALYIRDQVNPQLFQRALKSAFNDGSRGQIYEQHRKKRALKQATGTCQEIRRRPWEVNYLLQFPMKFVERNVFKFIRENMFSSNSFCLEKEELPENLTGADKEQLLWYFRDDFGLNAHHDAWHATYPKNISAGFPHKSRRGELFYYMHSQLLARYNFERLANGLNKTVALYIELGGNILEGYSNNLSASENIAFPSRPANTKLGDFYYCEDGLEYKEAACENKTLRKISDFKDWTQNIIEAIEKNQIFFADGTEVKPIAEENFIDILVDIVESTKASPDKARYGNMHNLGHQAVAVAQNKTKNKFITDVQGVMTDLAAAVRDPTFYRWHTRLQELYTMHKDKLPPYTNSQLGFDGVKIKSVEVKTEDKDAGPNEFLTFYEYSVLNISEGTRGNFSQVLVCYQHLQHIQFTYSLEVESNRQVDGIVRIFMAPKNDEKGKALDFAQQRHLFFELDTFPHKLTKGKNVITRHSVNSSVATPTERSVDRRSVLNRHLKNSSKAVPDECGWPDNLLIPKGTLKGLATTLFVIITDYDKDRVGDLSMQDIECVAAVSVCGLGEDKPYPFKRPMGFPFDRRREENSITEFSSLPNMHVIDTKVRFTNRPLLHKFDH